MITGKQKIVALTGITIESKIHGIFIYLSNLLFKNGGRSNIPAVANTDNAKPGSIAWKGSTNTNSEIAHPSDGMPKDLSPNTLAIKTTAVITAARNTDGVGRTRNIKINRIKKTR